MLDQNIYYRLLTKWINSLIGLYHIHLKNIFHGEKYNNKEIELLIVSTD